MSNLSVPLWIKKLKCWSFVSRVKCWICENMDCQKVKNLCTTLFVMEYKCMNVRLHCPCFSLALSATARINSQWHSTASAVLLGPVSSNQWSELFTGFCLDWMMFLEGKLKFTRRDATPPLLSYVWPCSHHPSVSSVLPAVHSALLNLAMEAKQDKGLKCGCQWNYQKDPNLIKYTQYCKLSGGF